MIVVVISDENDDGDNCGGNGDGSNSAFDGDEWWW
jgi:hypothetical protein